MIIVPHQDDEILMTAGVIREAVTAGIPVEIVMATNGDYGCEDHSVGEARLRESLAGLALLGVGPEQFHIMGYADTGMPEKDSFLTHLYYETDADRVRTSSCSSVTYGLPEKPEYHMQQYGEHAPYCRTAFKGDLKELVRRMHPARIYTTAKYDQHGDHSALYRFVCEVLDELEAEEAYAPELLIGVIHSNAGDENWPARNTAVYDCPRDFERVTGLKWEDRIRVKLPGEMRRSMGKENLKERALCLYETALEPNAVEFLMAFIKDEEIFWRVRTKAEEVR